MTFNPFYKFKYSDDVFIKMNISKLIPSTKEISDFVDNHFTEINQYIAEASILLCEDGLPSMVDELLVETKENAIHHLNFILNDYVNNVLKSGLDYTEKEFYIWKNLIVTFFIYSWFEKDTGLKILLYSPRAINPLGLLKSSKIKEQFESKSMDTMIEKYFSIQDINKDMGLKVISKIKLFGYSDKLLEILEPLPFLRYGPVMDILNHYIFKNDKESHTRAGLLVSLYFSKSTISSVLKI